MPCGTLPVAREPRAAPPKLAAREHQGPACVYQNVKARRRPACLHFDFGVNSSSRLISPLRSWTHYSICALSAARSSWLSDKDAMRLAQSRLIGSLTVRAMRQHFFFSHLISRVASTTLHYTTKADCAEFECVSFTDMKIEINIAGAQLISRFPLRLRLDAPITVMGEQCLALWCS
jgi:hypothetical protein